MSRLGHWRSWLEIDRAVLLGVSDQMAVPIAAGWLAPSILLPESLEHCEDGRFVDAVLLHELCHIKRGDYLWGLMHKIVSIVYWPHPLVWPLGRFIRRLREEACDDLCVGALSGPADYRAALLRVAEGLLIGRRPQGLELGMAMAQSTRLGWRLARIEQSRGLSCCVPGRWNRGSFIASLTLLAVFLGSVEAKRTTARGMLVASEARTDDQPAAEQAARAVGPPRPDASSRAVPVTVVDVRTLKPISGATVLNRLDVRKDYLTTDEQGGVRVPRSADLGPERMMIDVWKDGYIQQRFGWGSHQNDGPIPDRFTIKLLPGEVTWGGVVKDQAGKPISDVLVELWGYLKEVKEPHECCVHVRSKTDAQGQWRNSSLREMSFIYLYLSHPEFVADDAFHPRRFGQPGDRDKAPSPDLDRLRKHTDVQVMQHGVDLRGRVVDEVGRPIPASEVCWFEDRHQLGPDASKATTAADGTFRFAHVRPGKVRVLAKATKHAPGLVIARAGVGTEPIELRLTPGRPLAGRVVDPEGKPIAGARINIYTSFGYPDSVVFLRTDRDGRFRSDEATSDGLMVGVSQPGYLPIRNRSILADGKELSFTLTPSLQIAGRVRDETTRKAPSQHVEVETGIVDPKTGQVANWGRDTGSFVREGRFQVETDATRSLAYKLRITATGYEPFVSRSFETREGYANLDVYLKKLGADASKTPAALLRGPDGKPLAGASVVISQGGQTSPGDVYISRGKIAGADQHMIAKTGADGRFSLPSLGGPYQVLAFTDAHFAIATRDELEKTKELTARAWGRVEGQLFVGSKPGAGYFVDLRSGTGIARSSPDGSEPGFSVSDKVRTDAEGRFVFPQVLPGYAYFFYGLTRDEEDGGNRGNRIVSVQAGQTLKLTLGGKGRPVVGRLAAPPDFGRAFDFSHDFRFRIEINKPWHYFPPEAVKSNDVLDAMVKAGRTDGAVIYRDQFIQINLRPREDGSFRVDDVPAGTYRCTTYLTGFHRPEYTSASGRRIANLEHFFTVPDMPGGRSDEPLDLGTITMHLVNPKPPGDGGVAPPFEVTTVDGKSLKLADYRGKLVLLNFWAPWKDQSLFQIPYLKDVAASFPADKLAIVNLISDFDPAESRKLAAEVGLPGALGFLGQWSTSPVIKEYEVESLPATFLIAPNGELLIPSGLSHSRFWMTQFKDEISKALKK